MALKRKLTEKARSVPAGIALGLLAELFVIMAGAALGAYLIVTEKLSQDAVNICAMITVLFGSAAGTAVSTVYIGKRRALVGLISGICGYLTLLGITAMFFEGQYAAMGETALMLVFGCGSVVLMGLLPEKGRKSRGRKRLFR